MSGKNIKPFGHCLSMRQEVEIDACTNCGECLAFCPVQDATGNPSISPPEKIRMFREFMRKTSGLKARLMGPQQVPDALLEDFVKAVFECTTCGACGEHCAVGIFTQRLWPALRREMVTRGLGPIGVQAKMQEVVTATGNVYNKPAAERFAPWFPDTVEVAPRAELAYYAGCTGCYEAQPMVRGDVLVLGAIGEPFTMLSAEDEVCCGFPLFVTGQWDLLEGLVKRLVRGYEERGVKTLICSCPCCVNIMSRDWPQLLGRPLPFAIRHITQHVLEAIEQGRLKITGRLEERVIYHDPCYLSRGVGVTEEPRAVLSAIPGVELLEFDRNRQQSRCCGAGGAARKVFSENATAMGRATVDEALHKGADRLILSCPACYGKFHESFGEHFEDTLRPRGGQHKGMVITDIMELLARLI